MCVCSARVENWWMVVNMSISLVSRLVKSSNLPKIFSMSKSNCFPLGQGLTLVHVSAQLERFLWQWGCALGLCSPCQGGVKGCLGCFVCVRHGSRCAEK